MIHCIFNKTTKEFVGGGFEGTRPIDPATEVLVVLDRYPDRRLERWDDADGVRPATAQELTDYDDAKSTQAATRDLDGMKALKALVIWAAGKHGITPAQARDEIIAIYKGL